MGVRAPATMTDVDTANLLATSCATYSPGLAVVTEKYPPPMDEILAAALEGAPGDVLAGLPLPERYRAAFVRREDAAMFDGVASEEKDPTKSIVVGEVPLPELAPDEAYVAVKASSINFNTVWTSIFEPLSTFGFLDRLGRESVWGCATPSTTTSWAPTRPGSCSGWAPRCAAGAPGTR